LFAGKKMTPLQHAVYGGNLPVVRYLLDHGADIHQEGELEGRGGFTAIHTAAQKGINTKQTSLMFSFFIRHIYWLPVQSLLLSCFFVVVDMPWNIRNSSGES
jgi:hypothetical protein